MCAKFTDIYLYHTTPQSGLTYTTIYYPNEVMYY